jgi:hypothetical protein
MESNQFTKLTAPGNFLNICSSIIQHVYKVEKSGEGCVMRDPTVVIEKSVDNDDDDDDDDDITVDRLVVCRLSWKIHMIQEGGRLLQNILHIIHILHGFAVSTISHLTIRYL